MRFGLVSRAQIIDRSIINQWTVCLCLEAKNAGDQSTMGVSLEKWANWWREMFALEIPKQLYDTNVIIARRLIIYRPSRRSAI